MDAQLPKPELIPDKEAKCPHCGQFVSVVTGKSEDTEVRYHIIGHMVLKRVKKGLATYRMCKGSGYVSVWDEEHHKHVYRPN